MFFDHAVLAGPHQAIVTLQRALGVSADGHIGVVTSAALVNARPLEIVDRMADGRRAFYNHLVATIPHDRKFYKGWNSRVSFAQKNAHTLVTE